MTAEDIHNWDPKKLLHATADRLEAARHIIPTSMQSHCDKIIADYGKRIDENRIYYWASERMREIYNKFSPEEVKYREEFEASFPGENADIFRAACKHYGGTGYYHIIVSVVPSAFIDGDDDAYTPTPDDFKALTQNKYFPKIWAAQQAKPRYEVGDFICFRARSSLPVENPLIDLIPWRQREGLWQMKQFAGKPGFIMQVSPVAPKSAAKNSNIYKILLAGKSTPMYVEERHIKKGKLPKKA